MYHRTVYGIYHLFVKDIYTCRYSFIYINVLGMYRREKQKYTPVVDSDFFPSEGSENGWRTGNKRGAFMIHALGSAQFLY